MDSDEDVRMDNAEPIAWPSSGKGKGKGKATAHEQPCDDENLPWYASLLPHDSLHGLQAANTAMAAGALGNDHAVLMDFVATPESSIVPTLRSPRLEVLTLRRAYVLVERLTESQGREVSSSDTERRCITPRHYKHQYVICFGNV